MPQLTTRFAPSPNGYLHLGHALSALTAFDIARREKGRFLLRIEDIDPERCRAEYEAAIYEDLSWLGLEWEEPVRVQSRHMDDYTGALERLQASGVAYPCFCSRKEIAEAIRVSDTEVPGLDGSQYPGTCRALPASRVEQLIAEGTPHSWRLDSAKSASLTGVLTWSDRRAGEQSVDPSSQGDVVIARQDVPTSYHLSVTVDDYLQGITLVVRGMDLFTSTAVHRTLQALLGYETPEYNHHALLIDPATGDKLSKREGSTALRTLRAEGVTADEVRRRVGF